MIVDLAQVYSREYLQGLVLQNKKNEIGQITSLFIDNLMKVAGHGSTQYKVDFSNVRFDPTGFQTLILDNTLRTVVYFNSITEMIPFFQEKFPDCFVREYQDWEDTVHTAVLKRGLIIDWSA
jgi:hypothetical protein